MFCSLIITWKVMKQGVDVIDLACKIDSTNKGHGP